MDGPHDDVGASRSTTTEDRRSRRRAVGSGTGRGPLRRPDGRRALPVGRVLGGLRRGSSPPGDDGQAVGRGRRSRWSPGRDQLHLVASLVGGGVAVDAALAALGDASSGPARPAAARAADLVRGGTPPSRALQAVGAEAHVVALVNSGERSGAVASALRDAGNVCGQLERIRTTLRGALVYPAVVLAVGLAMVTVIAVLVVPPLERTFLDLGGQLPQPTRVVLAASAFVRRGGVVPLLALAVVVRPMLRRVGAGRESTILERLPVIGALRRDIDLAVLARMLATLLGAGVPLDESLRASASVIRGGRVRRAVEHAEAQVERGGSSVADEGLGPLIGSTDRALLEVGERNGVLAAQWARVADRRAEVLDVRVQHVGAIIEPLMVVAVGLLVGGAVLALYLPTFRILELV